MTTAPCLRLLVPAAEAFLKIVTDLRRTPAADLGRRDERD
jgi:hypothetical protein